MAWRQFWLAMVLLGIPLAFVLAVEERARIQERMICRHAIQRAFGVARAEAERIIDEQHEMEER